MHAALKYAPMAPIFGLGFWGTYTLADGEKIKIGDLFNNPIVKATTSGENSTADHEKKPFSSKKLICQVLGKEKDPQKTFCTNEDSNQGSGIHEVNADLKRVYEESMRNDESNKTMDYDKLFEGVSKWCDTQRSRPITEVNASLNWHMIMFCSDEKRIRR